MVTKLRGLKQCISRFVQGARAAGGELRDGNLLHFTEEAHTLMKARTVVKEAVQLVEDAKT